RFEVGHQFGQLARTQPPAQRSKNGTQASTSKDEVDQSDAVVEEGRYPVAAPYPALAQPGGRRIGASLKIPVGEGLVALRQDEGHAIRPLARQAIQPGKRKIGPARNAGGHGYSLLSSRDGVLGVLDKRHEDPTESLRLLQMG